MKLKRIRLSYRGKKFDLNLSVYEGYERIIGLMFKPRETARALLFDFGKMTREPIHSWFVFFPFVVLWLDDKNKIIEFKKVKPFRFYIAPKKYYSKLIEIPCNKKYSRVVNHLVDR